MDMVMDMDTVTAMDMVKNKKRARNARLTFLA